MLYIKSFKNYEEFKELFGVVEHGNGVSSRRNKILLSCLKDRKLLHWWRSYVERLADFLRREPLEATECDYLHAKSMGELKEFILYVLDYCVRHECMWSGEEAWNLPLGIPYHLHSRKYGIDELHGVCADGDRKTIRYVSLGRGRVFKMKAGKFISSIIEEFECTRALPEQLKRWIGEEFAREWQSHASQYTGNSKFELHVGDDFSAIYDGSRCRGDFHSCMTNTNQYSFYEDSVDASAAYLTDADGMIVARCIVFNKVYDDDGNLYRLAERQYATGQDNVLKQILVDKLIREGRIDGYKRIGVDCHANKNFVMNNGESLEDTTLHIHCSLVSGDTLSYQDSFVYYDETRGVAYNDTCHDYNTELNITDSTYHSSGDVWSEYEDSYIPEDEAERDEWFDDYILAVDTCNIISGGRYYTSCRGRLENNEDYVWSEYEDAFLRKEEAVDVGGDYEYDWRIEDKCVLDIDGDWRPKEDCEYSSVLDEYILHEDAVWSDYRDSYLPKDSSVFCEAENDWQLEDAAYYSDVTERYYLSLDSRLEDEEIYKKTHALACV